MLITNTRTVNDMKLFLFTSHGYNGIDGDIIVGVILEEKECGT